VPRLARVTPEHRRLLAAALATARSVEPQLASWEEAAAALEHEHEHWRLPEIGDVLAELDRA
jgi:hypothetical protein